MSTEILKRRRRHEMLQANTVPSLSHRTICTMQIFDEAGELSTASFV
jgi:hypothetical protein